MTTQTEHIIRTGLILVLTLAVGAAWIWAPLDPEMQARLEGVLLLLGPALLDSLNVARRQRVSATSATPAALILLLPLLLVGCGGATADTVARQTIIAVGTGLVAIEEDVGEAQAAERSRIAAERPTQDVARQRLSPYWRVGDAARGLRALLFAAERALDAHGANGVRELAGCLVELVARLREAVAVLGELGVRVPIPGEVDSALRVLAPYGATCPEGGA